MKTWQIAALGAALVLAAPAARAQEEPVTDRPDFTETSVVVQPWALQLEGGFTWAGYEDDLTTFHAPELLTRWGLPGRTELRLGFDHGWAFLDGERVHDAGELYVGGKVQLGPDGARWGVALIPAVTVELGDADSTTAYEIVGTWAFELSSRAQIGGIAGFSYNDVTDEDEKFATVSVARDLGEKVGAFLEWAAEFPEIGDAAHLLHHGYTYAVGQRVQLDVHGGIGLTDAAPEWFVGAGFAMKWSRAIR